MRLSRAASKGVGIKPEQGRGEPWLAHSLSRKDSRTGERADGFNHAAPPTKEGKLVVFIGPGELPATAQEEEPPQPEQGQRGRLGDDRHAADVEIRGR